MKIFEIGVAKTGTTSLGRAFEILGFTHIGFKGEYYLPKSNPTREETWSVVCEVADKYESFTDGPWHDIPFKMWDERYPNSKFIILERGGESWINSQEYHQINVMGIDFDIEASLDYKRTKYGKIKKYFKNRPDDLLVMNICDGEGWEILCPFLGKDIPDVPFPKLNVTESK